MDDYIAFILTGFNLVGGMPIDQPSPSTEDLPISFISPPTTGDMNEIDESSDVGGDTNIPKNDGGTIMLYCVILLTYWIDTW